MFNKRRTYMRIYEVGRRLSVLTVMTRTVSTHNILVLVTLSSSTVTVFSARMESDSGDRTCTRYQTTQGGVRHRCDIHSLQSRWGRHCMRLIPGRKCLLEVRPDDRLMEKRQQ